MNFIKDIKSIDLIGGPNEEELQITFGYDSTHKRKKIMSKLSGKQIKVIFKNENIPDWLSAEEFNEKFPVGTIVRYYPIKGKPNRITCKTTTPAWELGSGTAVVTIESVSGGVCLSHIEIVEAKKHSICPF